MIQSARDGAWSKLDQTEPRKALAGRPMPTGPARSGVGSRPLCSVLSTWNPKRVGKPPFVRDAI
jgi:hypothetical protein